MLKKLNTEQLKRIVLGALLLLIVLVSFNIVLLGPGIQRAARVEKELADLRDKLDKARKQVARTKGLETEFAAIEATVQQLVAQLPTATPITWFPPKMRAFFARRQIERCDTQKERDGTAFDELATIAWSTDLPEIDFLQLGHAIEALENSDPLLEITALTVEADAKRPEVQRANLRLTTIMRR